MCNDKDNILFPFMPGVTYDLVESVRFKYAVTYRIAPTKGFVWYVRLQPVGLEWPYCRYMKVPTGIDCKIIETNKSPTTTRYQPQVF